MDKRDQTKKRKRQSDRPDKFKKVKTDPEVAEKTEEEIKPEKPEEIIPEQTEKTEAEAKPEKKPMAPEALLYLQQWKDESSSWKFKKLVQVWLLKNMYNSEEVPKSTFSILVDYLANIRG